MPEVLIMAEDGCNVPRQRRGPLQPSKAIINTKGIINGMLLMLSWPFHIGLVI